VLLNAVLLEPLQSLVRSLPVVGGAMSAYRQLRALPADAPSDHSARESGPALAAAPRLNVRGPLALGLAAILLFVAAGLGATYARLGDLAGLTGGAIFETRLAALQYAKVGAGARVHVTPGADVKAGDLIITRDTTELDRQISMLKALAEAARSQLALISQETSAMLGPTEPLPADRPKLASLERRIGELENEGRELLTRIAQTEQELARSQIRAPVSGRVVALNVHGADAPIAPGAIEVEIATADRPLLYRLIDPMLRHKRTASTVRSVTDLGKEP
jgi:multidrug efflux pump subunit AcrA (membrane-fusion protein)